MFYVKLRRPVFRSYAKNVPTSDTILIMFKAFTDESKYTIVSSTSERPMHVTEVAREDEVHDKTRE